MIVDVAKINTLLEQLLKLDVVKSIKPKLVFPDEPRYFLYNCKLNPVGKFSDGKNLDYVAGTGGSFSTREEALLKCLSEAVERYSVCVYKKSDIHYLTYKDLKIPGLFPEKIFASPEQANNQIGWTEGFNLTTGEKTLLPAQAIYLNFQFDGKETVFSQQITTGAASGFNKEKTLLRGIYEIVERDAFITSYLNKYAGRLINHNSIKERDINDFIVRANDNNLEIFLIEITNDLDIPVILCIMKDATGLGPAIACGLKASSNKVDALKGAISEAMLIRVWMREMMIKNRQKKTIISKEISNQEERSLFWSPVSRIKDVDFWLKQPEKKMIIHPFLNSPKKELVHTINKLKEKGFTIYAKDIGIESFKKIGHQTYRIIIPELQPLYMNENTRVINKKRLRDSAKYLKLTPRAINPIPHPFL